MPFLEHLEELRWRLLKSLVAVLVGALAGWVIVEHWPVLAVLKAPITPFLPQGRLVYTSPAEPFFITLKLAVAVGVVLASPVVIYQIWAFLAPALYAREKRVILPSLFAGLALFAAGAAGAYFLVLPRALRVLVSFQQGELAPMITADRYFVFTAQLLLAFGAITELPLVMMILAAFGLVTPRGLARNRRWALLGAAAVAAFLAPPDALSMMFMMVPLLVLYEVSIACVWLVTRRRARREAAARAGATALLVAVALLAGAGRAAGQVVPKRPPTPPGARPAGQDTGRVAAPGAQGPAPGVKLDTASARRLGLPSAPSRSFPQADAFLDSLLKLPGYRRTRYVADTMVVRGDSQTVDLHGEALLDHEGSKLEADNVRYHQGSCLVEAAGAPKVFDQNSVIVSGAPATAPGMRYDTCTKRAVVSDALTDFAQGGATWYMRGDVAADSGSKQMFGAHSSITSCDLPVPDYHFAAGEVKWINKSTMVARPAVLYVRDVPIMWLPFIFQDIRGGRRSGIIVPRFGLNDLVRPTRSYQRHITNLGYYWAANDYFDLLGTVDWFAGRNVALHGQARYRWLDRFITGGVAYTRLDELDQSGTSTRISWFHQQAFDSRTHFSANVDYATSGQVVQRNTVNPFVSLAQLSSRANFDKRFDWGALNIGGSRTQNLSTALVSQTFPQVAFTPTPVNIGAGITWSPGFSYTNTQSFHNPVGFLPAVVGGVLDTVAEFADQRQTAIAFQTPVRFGGWNWQNSFTISDVASNQRREFVVADSADPTVLHHRVYARTFETRADWQTGINLPLIFSGSWKLQPGVQILNAISGAPFEIRNQFTGGQWVRQKKRLAFTASLAPTLFGFFPGVGPLARIRHSVQFLVSYLYAPPSRVSDAFAHAVDPSGLNPAARTDPQQTVSFGLSQNFEGKLKPAPGDTTGQQTRKLRLLSISTSQVSYNFERAKEPGLTGWQTQSLSNTFASDLLPGFSLSLTHDLWNGPVGFRRSTFSPYLTNVSASFSVSGNTLRALGGLVGLGGGKAAPPPAAAPGGAGAQPGAIPGATGLGAGYPSGLGGPAFRGSYGPGLGPPAGGGFNLSVTFTSTRFRPIRDSSVFAPVQTDSLYNQTPIIQTPVQQFFPQPGAGQEQANFTLSFSPTANWSVQWTSTYDLKTRQFGQHYLRLDRKMHRWSASFSFAKSPNGNLAFSFYISLSDEPDIKFDYDQQSYAQP